MDNIFNSLENRDVTIPCQTKKERKDGN